MDSAIQESPPTPAIRGNKLELLRRRLRTSIDGLSSEAIRPVTRAQPLQLSFAQERLWFLDRLGLVGSAYNIALAVRLREKLDTDALSAALTEIIRRHEALRTRFAMSDGAGIQIIDSPWPVNLAPVTLDLDQARDRARKVMDEPFDLAKDRLLRCELLRLATDDHVLVLAMHHIVSDGWSMGVLFRELGSLYASFCAGDASPLKPLPLQYADYAAWHRGWVSERMLQPQLAYWTARLADAPAGLDMPTDRPRPARQSFRGAVHRFEVGRELTAVLSALARQEGATLFMVLLAAFKVLLKRWTGQDDVIVGTPIAGRTRGEIEHLIGFFVNMLALRTDLSGDPSFRRVVRRVKETALGAYAHQDLPFEKLVDALHPVRDLSRQPIFQVVFALQDVSLEQVSLHGLVVDRFGDETASARFDLECAMTETDGRLVATLGYATDLFDAGTIERMAG
ncbi:MAG: hypothetical protein V7608_5408, partial [Hyphomicrobiales bacterium]